MELRKDIHSLVYVPDDGFVRQNFFALCSLLFALCSLLSVQHVRYAESALTNVGVNCFLFHIRLRITSVPTERFAGRDYRSPRHGDDIHQCLSSVWADRRWSRSACLCQTLQNNRLLRG
jgi:hypothetical protein